MSNFKAGMQVYSPTEGTDILEVATNDDVMYPIGVGNRSYTEYGMYHNTDHHPSIFHATKENQALLEALYGVKFDDPPLSDKEKVIEALKNANGKPVLCWASNSQEFWCLQGITSHHPSNGFLSLYGGNWSYAKPIAPDEFVLV